MADKQPEALRRADALEQYAIDANSGDPRIVEAVAELRRLSAVEAERDEDRRREYGYSQQTVDAITNERDALRAERDALRDEKYRLRHLLAQARFFVDRAPHGDERDCPVCEFVNRIDAALAEKGGGNG